MIKLNEKNLKLIAWAFLGTGLLANLTVPYAAQFYVDYYKRLTSCSDALYNVLLAFSKNGRLTIGLNSHFTIFGVVSFYVLRSASLSDGTISAYCRYTGLLTAGASMVLLSFFGYCSLLSAKESLAGVGYFALPPAALLLALPTFFIGWLWGLWRLKKLVNALRLCRLGRCFRSS